MIVDREAGAGTALAVLVLGAVVALFAVLAPLGVVLAAGRRAAAAADAAALAGADTAMGVAAGVPCERAAEVATDDGAVLEGCRQREEDVRVRVRVDVLGFAVRQDAVAGPPP